MIFARDLSDPLASLAKKIDAATAKNMEHKMGSFIVFLNDDEELDKKLKDLADKEQRQRQGCPRGYTVGHEKVTSNC